MYLGLPISNFGSPKGSRKIFLGSSLENTYLFLYQNFSVVTLLEEYVTLHGKTYLNAYPLNG